MEKSAKTMETNLLLLPRNCMRNMFLSFQFAHKQRYIYCIQKKLISIHLIYIRHTVLEKFKSTTFQCHDIECVIRSDKFDNYNLFCKKQHFIDSRKLCWYVQYCRRKKRTNLITALSTFLLIWVSSFEEILAYDNE